MNEFVQLPVAGRAQGEFKVGDIEGTAHDRSYPLPTNRSYRLRQELFKKTRCERIFNTLSGVNNARLHIHLNIDIL
jgi:hypothetical protein